MGTPLAMFRFMRKGISSVTAAIFSLAVAAAVAGCGGSNDEPLPPQNQNPNSTLNVVNDSDFAIQEIYLTYTDSSDWGPNHLSGDVLLPGERILLTGIPCDTYDVRLVAEDGVECEHDSLDLCFNDATWHITNDTCDLHPKAASEQARSADPSSI